MFTVYIRFLSLSNFWMHLFQAWPIKCTYIHHTYQRASLDSESTVVLCYFALVASPGAFIDSGGFFQNWGPRPSILENWLAAHHDHGARCNAESISKASLFQNWGSGPQFWKTTTFLKNGQLRGQKHLKNAQKFFYSLPTYGWNFSGRTEHGNDVIFFLFLATVFGNLEVWKVKKWNIFLKYISAPV